MNPFKNWKIEDVNKHNELVAKNDGYHILSECQHCHKSFSAYRFDVVKGMGRFCSQQCYGQWKVVNGTHAGDKNPNWQGGISQTTRTCQMCAAKFTIPTKDIKRGQAGKFCSNKCYWASCTDQRFQRPNKYKSGKRNDLGGLFLRSKWEANWARYLNWRILNGEIKGWEYEPETFWFESIKRGVRSYTPDFKVAMNDGSVVYEEVKGYMDNRSATKLKRMKKYHPGIPIVIVDKSRYLSVMKTVGPLLQGLE